MSNDIMDDPEFREIAQGFSDSAAGFISLFAEKYFKKDILKLSADENRELDSFGLCGCIAWLEDHGYLKEEE